MIDETQVRHVAKLARLDLTDDEVALFSTQLSAVLDYIGQMNELDTDDVEPLSHPLEVTNVLREDEVRPSMPRDEVLANAPRHEGGFFLVPAVLDFDETGGQ